VELQEAQFEDQTHEAVEVEGVLHLLGLEALLEAALGQAVVARVQLEGRQAVLNQVAVDLDPGLQVVQLVLTRVPLEDFGADAFVGRQEPQLHLLAAQFCEHLIELGDFSVFHEAALEVGDSVSEEDHPVHTRLVVLLPVQDRLLHELLELEFGFVRVLEFTLLFVLHELVGPEVREVPAGLGEHCSHTLVSFAVLDVHGEHHGPAAQPLAHGGLEVDAVADVVGQLHHHVLHDVEHDHFDEVPLFEGLREDHLVGYLPLLVAVLLDDLLLACELVGPALAVQHHHHDFVVFDLPVEVGQVLDLHHVGGRNLQALQPAQLVLHLLHHRLNLLLHARHTFEHDGPPFQLVLRKVE